MTGETVARVLVAIPAYNEEASLARVLEDVRRCNPSADLLVVDDGSTDATVEVAEEMAVPVVRLPFNLGVGGAMRTAFKYARHNNYDCLVQVDADGQHDPAQIPLLVRSLEHADVVVGARFAGVGDYAVTPVRRGAMRALARVVSHMSGAELTDVTSGFRASNRRAIETFSIHYPAEYLGDTVESLVIALRTGLVVKQVPVGMEPRRQGRPSQSRTRSGGYLLRVVGALALALVREWPVPDLMADNAAPSRLS